MDAHTVWVPGDSGSIADGDAATPDASAGGAGETAGPDAGRSSPLASDSSANRSPSLNWAVLQLCGTHHLPALERILQQKLQAATSGSASTVTAAGAALPVEVSAALLQWETHQSLLYHGLQGAGELLHALYAYCPDALRVSHLVSEYMQYCEAGLQLMYSPLSAIGQARGAPSGGAATLSSGQQLLLSQLLALEEWSFGQVGRLLWQQLLEVNATAGKLAEQQLLALEQHTSALLDEWQAAGRKLVEERHDGRMATIRRAREEAEALQRAYIERQQQAVGDLALLLQTIRLAAELTAAGLQQLYIAAVHRTLSRCGVMQLSQQLSYIAAQLQGMYVPLHEVWTVRTPSRPSDGEDPSVGDTAALACVPVQQRFFKRYPRHVTLTSSSLPVLAGADAVDLERVVSVELSVQGGVLLGQSEFNVPRASKPLWLSVDAEVHDPDAFAVECTLWCKPAPLTAAATAPESGWLGVRIVRRVVRKVVTTVASYAQAVMGFEEYVAVPPQQPLTLHDMLDGGGPSNSGSEPGLRLLCAGGSWMALDVRPSMEDYCWAPDLQADAATAADAFRPSAEALQALRDDEPLGEFVASERTDSSGAWMPGEWRLPLISGLNKMLMDTEKQALSVRGALREQPPPSTELASAHLDAEKVKDEDAMRSNRHFNLLQRHQAALRKEVEALRTLRVAFFSALALTPPTATAGAGAGAEPSLLDVWLSCKHLLQQLMKSDHTEGFRRLTALAQEAAAMPPLERYSPTHPQPLSRCGSLAMAGVFERVRAGFVHNAVAGALATPPLVHRLMSLAVCALAATARSERELGAAQEQLQLAEKVLESLAAGLTHSSSSMLQVRQTSYIVAVAKEILKRKLAALASLRRSRELLSRELRPAAQPAVVLAALRKAVRGAEELTLQLLAEHSGGGGLFWAGGGAEAALLEFGDVLLRSGKSLPVRIINSSDRNVELRVLLLGGAAGESSAAVASGESGAAFRVVPDRVHLSAQRAAVLNFAIDSSCAAAAVPGVLSAAFQLFSPLVGEALVLRCRVRLQELAVALAPSEALGFGVLTTRTQRSAKVAVTNQTGVPLRVKADVVGSPAVPEAAEAARATSGPSARISSSCDVLPPYATETLEVTLEAGAADVSSLSCFALALAVNSSARQYHLPLAGSVVQPRYQLEWLDARQDGAVTATPLRAGSCVTGPAIQPGEQHDLRLALRNTGSVPFSFCLSSGGAQLQVRSAASGAAPACSHGGGQASTAPAGSSYSAQVLAGGCAQLELVCMGPAEAARPRASQQRVECALTVSGLEPVTFAVEWLVAVGQLRLSPGALGAPVSFALSPANKAQLDACYEGGVFIGIPAVLRAQNTGQVPVRLLGLDSGDRVECVSPALPLTLQPGAAEQDVKLRLRRSAVLDIIRRMGSGDPGTSFDLVVLTSIRGKLALRCQVAIAMPRLQPQPDHHSVSLRPGDRKPLSVVVSNRGTAPAVFFIWAQEPPQQGQQAQQSQAGGTPAAAAQSGGSGPLSLVLKRGKQVVLAPDSSMDVLPVKFEVHPNRDVSFELTVSIAEDAVPGTIELYVQVRQVAVLCIQRCL